MNDFAHAQDLALEEYRFQLEVSAAEHERRWNELEALHKRVCRRWEWTMRMGCGAIWALAAWNLYHAWVAP